ncbi:19990_t:CDS:2, partial [Racocetra fulgida]
IFTLKKLDKIQDIINEVFGNQLIDDMQHLQALKLTLKILEDFTSNQKEIKEANQSSTYLHMPIWPCYIDGIEVKKNAILISKISDMNNNKRMLGIINCYKDKVRAENNDKTYLNSARNFEYDGSANIDISGNKIDKKILALNWTIIMMRYTSMKIIIGVKIDKYKVSIEYTKSTNIYQAEDERTYRPRNCYKRGVEVKIE